MAGELRLKTILFGNDYVGTVMDEKSPYTDLKTGIKYKEYLVAPHPDLIEAYPDLKNPNSLPISTPYGRSIWVAYPIEMVSDKNPSRKNAIARIDCGFDGSETWQTERRADLLDEIKNLRAKLNSALMSNIDLRNYISLLMGSTKAMAKDMQELHEILKGDTAESQEEFENQNPQSQQQT